MANLKQACWPNGQGYGTLTSTRRMPTFAVFWPGTITVAGQATQPVNHAVTIRNWYMRLATAPGVGITRTWTVYKNGSPTSLAVAIAGTNTDGSDTSNEVSFAAGDTTYVEETVTGGTPADPGVVQSVFEIENPNSVTSLGVFGDPSLLPATAVHYTGLLWGAEWVNTASPDNLGVDNLVGTDGTITGYRIRLSAAPGAAASGKSRAFVIEKNGTAQDGSGGTPDTTITLLETATSGSASFSLSVVAGDRVRIKQTPTASPTNAAAEGTATFVATASGRYHLGYSLTESMATGATEYAPVFGGYPIGAGGGWSTTEADRENIGPPSSIAPLSFSGMYVDLPASPGSGKSYTFTLRKNNADTAQAVTISDAATTGTSAGGAVSVDRTDRMALQSVPSGAPTITRLRMVFLMTDPIAAIVGGNQMLLVSP